MTARRLLQRYLDHLAHERRIEVLVRRERLRQRLALLHRSPAAHQYVTDVEVLHDVVRDVPLAMSAAEFRQAGHELVDMIAQFLESVPEVEEYWNNVVGLIDSQVGTYLTRGFTSLSVYFGCTGGQHRSVYFAERLGRHLRERFPEAHLDLAHREQGSWPTAGHPAASASPAGEG